MMYDDEKTPQEDNETDYDPTPVTLDEQELGVTINLEAGFNDGEEDPRHWYVVHCYSGYEQKVRDAIMQRIDTMGMRDRIFDVIIPEEEEIEIKDGKRIAKPKKIFPGYIMVEMALDEDSWYVVRNTPGVTGFVGMGNDPIPLRPDEVKQIIDRMNDEQPKWNVNFKVGQKVRITGGPFNDFVGSVSAIDQDKAKVRVMVDFFGRETPVELDFTEVDAV